MRIKDVVEVDGVDEAVDVFIVELERVVAYHCTMKFGWYTQHCSKWSITVDAHHRSSPNFNQILPTSRSGEIQAVHKNL